jgi:pimeloyl-ACP methyl ester carboxylesterase
MRFDIDPIAQPAIITAQLAACTQWMTGNDPDGAKLSSVKARTLVGGGRQDGLLPVANQQHIAQVIPHAKLVTYPDAAHGFFFQESADFLPRLTAFLR